jgi:hypothetical protein
MRTPTAIALIASLALIGLSVAVTLANSPARLAGDNSISDDETLALTQRDGSRACQGKETLPSETSAIRLSLSTNIGPRVSVSVLSGTEIATHGVQNGGWTGGEVTIPVTPLPHRLTNVTVCTLLSNYNGEVGVNGQATPSPEAAIGNGGEKLPGRYTIEYLRAGDRSWLSQVASVARHMSLGRAASGIWVVFLALALLLTVVTITSWAIVRELG